MKINARQNAIVARRMARQRFDGADIPGKARKTNVVPASHKAVRKWDEGNAGYLAYKYPAFDVRAELALWEDETSLVDPVIAEMELEERNEREATTWVSCPFCADLGWGEPNVTILCDWCNDGYDDVARGALRLCDLRFHAERRERFLKGFAPLWEGDVRYADEMQKEVDRAYAVIDAD